MFAIFISTLTLSVLGLEGVTNGLQTAESQNLASAFLNKYIAGSKDTPLYAPSIQLQTTTPQHRPADAAGCPSAAVLLSILNVLIDSLPRNDNNNWAPDKLKYVLSVAKTVLGATPLQPENLDMYYRLKNLETLVDKINVSTDNPHSIELDNNLRAKVLLQQARALPRSSCRDVLDSLISFINTSYSLVLQYCLSTANCNIDNENSHSDIHKGNYPLNFIAPTHRNEIANLLPVPTTGAGFINSINNQKGKGLHNIMTILKNYRQPGVTYIPENSWKNIDSQNHLFNTLPENPLQASSFHPSTYEINGKNANQHSNIIYKPPVMLWKTQLPLHQGNNLGITNAIYTPVGTSAVETSSYLVNGQIVPKSILMPSNQRETIYSSTGIVKDPIFVNLLKQSSIPQQDLSQAEIISRIRKAPSLFDNTRLSQMQQNAPNLHDLKQPTLLQNILNQRLMLPQHRLPNITNGQHYIQNQPTLELNNHLLNQTPLSFSRVSPFASMYNTAYNNGQNIMFTDNTKQPSAGEQLINFNRVLGVANLGKLNSIPNKNGVVELTYVLKKPKPAYEPQYYVKYRLPHQTFLHNLQNLLVKTPHLRSEPNQLYYELLTGSNITDTSTDLKGLNYEDILNLTSANGALVTAKVLESNDTAVDQTLRVIQKLNSKLPVESIINFNVNSTNAIRLETAQSSGNVSKNSSTFVSTLQGARPAHYNLQTVGFRPIINAPFNTNGAMQHLSSYQINPYSIYQTKPDAYLGVPLLKYGGLPSTNILKNPTLLSSYLVRNNPQFKR